MWRDRKGSIAGRQIALGDPAVARRNRGDAGQGQLLGQAVLKGSEGALGTAARLGRRARDMANTELGQGAADLGARHPRDRLASLRVWK